MSDPRDVDRDIAEEDELAAILRSTEERIVVPPFADVARRAEGRRSGSSGLAVAAFAAVILVVAAIAAFRNGSTTDVSTASQSPAVSAPVATPTAPAASPSPTASSSAPATPDATHLRPEFAVIYDGVRQGYDKGSAPLVRREGETNRAVGELAPSFFEQFVGAVSPDGRRAAYFAQRQGEPWTLYLLDGTKPNEQRVLKPISGEIPREPPVWSSDGTGVAYVLLDEGANQGVTPKYSAIRTLDVSTGAVTEVARVTDGSSYSLVGWDRGRGIVAATRAPDRSPANTYLVFSNGGTKTWPIDGFYSSTSSNGRDVAGARCDTTKECSLWTWPLDDFGAKVDRKITNVSIVGWRPGTSEVVLLVAAPASTFDRVAVWTESGGLRIVGRFSGSGYSLTFLRADGSAVIVQASQTQASVVDLADGTVSQFPLHAPDGQYEPNRIKASIRLGQ